MARVEKQGWLVRRQQSLQLFPRNQDLWIDGCCEIAALILGHGLSERAFFAVPQGVPAVENRRAIAPTEIVERKPRARCEKWIIARQDHTVCGVDSRIAEQLFETGNGRQFVPDAVPAGH